MRTGTCTVVLADARVLRAMFVLVLALSACAPVATFPREQGTINPSARLNEPIPTLMAESIKYAWSRYGNEEEIAINLPPGTPPAVYDKVIRRIGAGRPMEIPDEPAYHVTRVLARGLEGHVDLFYPTEAGGYEMVTLTFRRDVLGSYRHEHTRVWRIGEEPPGPNYPTQTAAAN